MSREIKRPMKMMLLSGGLILCGWATAVLFAGLQQADWQLSVLLRHFLVASGLSGPLHSMVDFYTHIKGVEYIICVSFFVVFPLYFRFMEKDAKTIRRRAESATGQAGDIP